MKLGVVTDVEVAQHRGQLLSLRMELHQLAAFSPFFDEIHIFSPLSDSFDPDRPDLHRCECGNMRVVQVPDFHRTYGFLLHLRPIWRGLRRVLPQVDLVNVRLPRVYGLIAPRLCRELGIPYFISIHGDWMQQFDIAKSRGGWRRVLPYLAWLPERVTNLTVRDAVVFCTSPDILERVKPFARSVHLTYSSLLTESDLVTEPKCLHPGRPLRMLYAGGIAVNKGMPYVFEAARLLRDRGLDFEFHLAGRGALLEAGRAFAHQHGLDGRMVFHGFVPWGPELFEHFQQADIFVFPSLSEGSPKVILEAMFRALVIVTTGVGAIPSVITDGVSGRIVPRRDARAIADAVMDVVRDPERYRQMSAAALAQAAEMTKARVMQRWIDDLKRAGLYPAERGTAVGTPGGTRGAVPREP